MDGNGTKGYRISSGTAELIGHLDRVLSLAVEYEDILKLTGCDDKKSERLCDAYFEKASRMAEQIERDIARNIRMRLMLSRGEEI